jgi:hypothetical protein
VDPEESDQIPSPEDSEPADEAEAEEGSVAQDDDNRESEEDFESDSIQTAQDKIMTELTRLKDAE